jgi:hypothetical protein
MYLYDKQDKFRIFEIKEKKNRYTKMSLICSVYIKFILDKLLTITVYTSFQTGQIWSHLQAYEIYDNPILTTNLLQRE